MTAVSLGHRKIEETFCENRIDVILEEVMA